MTSKMYSGYLQADAAHGRYLFYAFVESQGDPRSDPVMLWSNGGPGCSGMEGMWKELGPYKTTNAAPGVVNNPLSWNRHINILFIEHPVGVGFSYSEVEADYSTHTDNRTSADLYNALQNFFEDFPEFLGRDLYLGGESYGGIYVPQLAHTIGFGPRDDMRDMLRGFAIGNPMLSCAADISGESDTQQLDMLFYHGILPYLGPYQEWHALQCGTRANVKSDACRSIFSSALRLVGASHQQIHRRQSAALLAATRPQAVPDGMAPAGKWEHGPLSRGQISTGAFDAARHPEPDYDSDHKYQSFCTDNNTLRFAEGPNGNDPQCHPLGDPGRLGEFMNRADVQRALRIRRPPPLAGGVWVDCTDDSDPMWRYTPSHTNSLTAYWEPLFARFPADRFRVLVFSGDEDLGTVPHAITQRCLSELPSMSRTRPWTPWRRDGILLGYWEEFDRYTFATVKGAGHTVAQYMPLAGMELFDRWLRNGDLTEVPPVPETSAAADAAEAQVVVGFL